MGTFQPRPRSPTSAKPPFQAALACAHSSWKLITLACTHTWSIIVIHFLFMLPLPTITISVFHAYFASPSHQLSSAAPLQHTKKISPDVTQEQPSTRLDHPAYSPSPTKGRRIGVPTSLFPSSTAGLLLSREANATATSCR